MKIRYPITLIKYLSLEFCKCLFFVFLSFLAISILTNFIEELVFFKEKNIDDFILKIVYLTLLKSINTLIETSIFIFLFSGFFFFVKILKNNEINTIKIAGISASLPIITASLVSFFFGLIIITVISPISSLGLKIYENNKRIYSNNDNLIVINDSGLWFMEKNKKKIKIIRSDKINNNDFTKLYNSTIYEMDTNFNFLKRYDTKLIFINKKKWILEDISILEENNLNKNNTNKISELTFNSSININDLKNLFTNVNTISFWEIFQNIENLNNRGYSGDELKIKFHKYLSLPFYLFAMIILSTLFTINIKKNYNNFIYIFLGVICGVIIYFLNDLSIAIGMANKVPLALSVWIPIFLIIVISVFNLINLNKN